MMKKKVVVCLVVGIMFAGIAMQADAQDREQKLRLSNKAVKDLQFRGRIHTQFGYVSGKNDEGSDDFSTFEVRRVRMGMRGTLFDDVRAQLEANLVPGSDLSMRSAFLEWREHKPAYIKVGLDKPLSSIEENTSSAEILTIERSVINGLVAAPGPLNGLSLSGDQGMLLYGAGVYTDAANRNPGGSDAEYMLNAMVGLKLDKMVGDKNKLLVRANYMSSDDAAGVVGKNHDDVMSVGAHLLVGAFDLRGECFSGDNDGNKHTGFYVTPSFCITPKVQAVARYEVAESDKSGGVRAPSRYARDIPSLKDRETEDADGNVISTVRPQRGDEYSAVYLGVNYYMSGHAHKLMFGVELAELANTPAGDLDTVTASVAWRTLF